VRTVCRSVVTVGIVHVSVTLSPLRVARKSEGGLGNSSDGGCGGAIVAHAVSISDAPSTSILLILLIRSLMAMETD
jgi:hypothetical protein